MAARSESVFIQLMIDKNIDSQSESSYGVDAERYL